MNKHNMFLGARGILFERARELRLRETPAEKMLWSKLSNKQMGVKFRRQHPVCDYIVDFYCHSLKIVIEVDGPVHSIKENVAYDKIRSETLQSFHIEVLRFTNDDVLSNMDGVIKKIKLHLAP